MGKLAGSICCLILGGGADSLSVIWEGVETYRHIGSWLLWKQEKAKEKALWLLTPPPPPPTTLFQLGQHVYTVTVVTPLVAFDWQHNTPISLSLRLLSFTFFTMLCQVVEKLSGPFWIYLIRGSFSQQPVRWGLLKMPCLMQLKTILTTENDAELDEFAPDERGNCKARAHCSVGLKTRILQDKNYCTLYIKC